jgi:hypothetical protein
LRQGLGPARAGFGGSRTRVDVPAVGVDFTLTAVAWHGFQAALRRPTLIRQAVNTNFFRALVMAGGVVVAALGGHDAALAYYRAHALDPVPALFARDPDIRLQRLENDLFVAGGKDPDPAAIATVSTQVLAHDPLNAQAMFMLGVAQALRKPGEGAALYLLAEQISRRHVPNEAALIATYAQHHDIDGIVRCFDRIFSVSPELVGAMMPALVASLGDPATRHAFAAYAGRPWMPGLIAVALNHAVDLGAIAALIDAAGRAGQGAVTLAPLRVRLLSKGLAGGDHDFARAQLALLPAPTRAALGQLGFSPANTSPDLAPLGWTLANDARQSAALDAQGSLVISMAAEQTGVVAERVTLMPPGRYRLSLRLGYEAARPRAALVWDVFCAGQTGALWHQPMPTRAGPTRYQTTLDLPQGCPAQHWSLRAVGDIGQSASRADLRDLAAMRQ